MTLPAESNFHKEQDMSKFKRENRYVVLKTKDIEMLSNEDRLGLDGLLHKINLVRVDRGKEVLQCVVVENDWPEHDLVWSLIKYRCETGEHAPLAVRRDVPPPGVSDDAAR